jgi:hypothetical protein
MASVSSGEFDTGRSPARPPDTPRDNGRLPACDRDPRDLHDQLDRDELRDRYYGLLQELRVLLPGVQVMVAFLFTVPFSGRFEQLDPIGTALFAVAISSGLLAVVSFIGPTAYHRLGDRTARSSRLLWSIRATVIGLGFLAVSLLTALALVSRFIYDGPVALVMTVVLGLAMLLLWVVIPRTVGPGSG